MKIRSYQERVYNWQRDVAAQPVTKTPTQRDPEFCKKQLGFTKSEWFNEYIQNAEAYTKALAMVYAGDDDIDETLKRIDKIRTKIADDIGDVAFTILGLLNAYGVMLDNLSFSRSTDMNLYRIDQRICDFLNEVEEEDKVSASDAKSALLDLIALSTYYAVNFWAALEAVCKSNDTKLWTLPEVHENEQKIESMKWTVTPVSGLRDDRCFRVKNTDGKLMKSPSFTEPDLRVAIMQFVDLT
jgi:hypothetical protein